MNATSSFPSVPSHAMGCSFPNHATPPAKWKKGSRHAPLELLGRMPRAMCYGERGKDGECLGMGQPEKTENDQSTDRGGCSFAEARR